MLMSGAPASISARSWDYPRNNNRGCLYCLTLNQNLGTWTDTYLYYSWSPANPNRWSDTLPTLTPSMPKQTSCGGTPQSEPPILPGPCSSLPFLPEPAGLYGHRGTCQRVASRWSLPCLCPHDHRRSPLFRHLHLNFRTYTKLHRLPQIPHYNRMLGRRLAGLYLFCRQRCHTWMEYGLALDAWKTYYYSMGFVGYRVALHYNRVVDTSFVRNDIVCLKNVWYTNTMEGFTNVPVANPYCWT